MEIPSFELLNSLSPVKSGRLLRQMEALGDLDEEQTRSLLDRVGELTAYRLHQADLGTEMMDTETQFLLASEQG